MFTVDFTGDAIDDLQIFRKFERQRIFTAIKEQLTHQPSVETRKLLSLLSAKSKGIGYTSEELSIDYENNCHGTTRS